MPTAPVAAARTFPSRVPQSPRRRHSPSPARFFATLVLFRIRGALPLVLALVALPAVAQPQPDPGAGYYRFPALHDDTLVFTAEGDLWRVAAGGGTAQRLTTHPGAETHAAISPDGRSVAFTAHYEGQTEVYAMPLAGGPPKRLTYEGESPGAQARGWTADGRVLYSTRHYSTLPSAQLVAVEPDSLARTVLPLAQADEGVYDDSGDTLFFTRFAAQSSHAKHYRGGTAQQLWRWRKDGPEAERFAPGHDGTSRWPMWSGGRVYFASDRQGPMNIWSARPDGSDLRQHTRHADFGVKHPSLSRGRIAYQNGADLWLLDLASGRTAVVPIRLASDFDHMREKWVTKPMDYLSSFALSPNGNRVALTVRGQIFVARAGGGRLVEVTRQSGVRYRQAEFLGADGKSLLMLSDESGEVEFWRAPANGVGDRTQLTRGGEVLRMEGFPSPDGQWFVSAERSQELWLFNVATGERRRLATSARRSFDSADVAWSADSRWLAFVNHGPNDFGVVYLARAAGGDPVAVTSDRTHSFSPAWSRDGRWLYFLSERTMQTLVGAPWGLRQPEPFLDRSVKIYGLALQSATRRSPFQPDDELSPAVPAAKSSDTTTPVQLEGLASRLWEVPVAAGNYSRLRAADKTLIFVERDRAADPAATTPATRLRAVEIKSNDIEVVTITDGTSGFEISSDGKKLGFRKSSNLYVIDAAAKAAGNLDKARVSLDALKFSFLPRESWRQMFTDAWRLHRDYFYDERMHGVDWRANLAKHLPLVDRITDRDELNDALAYMMSELSALHTAVQPGDTRTAPDDETIGVASLGARLERAAPSGGYRIVRIYRGDPDFPDRISPLARPGLQIAEGDIVESINGVSTLSVPDLSSLLRQQAGRQVLLRVKPASAVGTAATGTDHIVRPIPASAAATLRYSDWEHTRRLRVDAESDRQIGYVHLRAMGSDDYAQWARDYYPVIDRPGLILDLRHNRGGNIESWLLARLMRKDWMWWAPRFGEPSPNMQNPFRGHLVVLVNESTSSDGETMANGVRRLGLGTVIGTRTWGGGIWLRAINRLVDRGIITAAEMGSFVPGEGWVIEGPGLTPDVTVDNLPVATFRGEDAQLDAAIAKLKELIARAPRPVPAPPAPLVPPRN